MKQNILLISNSRFSTHWNQSWIGKKLAARKVNWGHIAIEQTRRRQVSVNRLRQLQIWQIGADGKEILFLPEMIFDSCLLSFHAQFLSGRVGGEKIWAVSFPYRTNKKQEDNFWKAVTETCINQLRKLTYSILTSDWK